MNKYVVLAYAVSMLMLGGLALYTWWHDSREQRRTRRLS